MSVYVEYLPSEQFARGLLHGLPVEIVQSWGVGSAVSSARASLLTHPEKPVAVLVRSRTESSVEVSEMRGALRRLLGSVHFENWCVAIAVPGLDAWAMTDPRIKRELEALNDGKATYTERAARFAELTQSQPFDATELLRSNEDYRRLVEFIQRHTPAETTRPAMTA
jgi:hypothetical protein